MSDGVVPGLPAGVRTVREVPADGPAPVHVHPEWVGSMPWLVQGTTGSGSAGDFDLGLAGATPVGEALGRWRTLQEATGLAGAVHSLQVHGREVLSHDGVHPGLRIVRGYDGHETGAAGLLLTVSVADCVPVSLVDPDRRRIALLHGGWRGTAGGVLAAGLERLGGDPSRLHLHLGPAICGRCYEVGPEVHEALGLEVPAAPAPVDVRAVQAGQAVAMGMDPERITVSEHCTRCGSGFYSHRAGSSGRQMGILGMRG